MPHDRKTSAETTAVIRWKEHSHSSFPTHFLTSLKQRKDLPQRMQIYAEPFNLACKLICTKTNFLTRKFIQFIYLNYINLPSWPLNGSYCLSWQLCYGALLFLNQKHRLLHLESKYESALFMHPNHPYNYSSPITVFSFYRVQTHYHFNSFQNG